MYQSKQLPCVHYQIAILGDICMPSNQEEVEKNNKKMGKRDI